MRVPAAACARGRWTVRSKSQVEVAVRLLEDGGLLELPGGLTWVLRQNSAAPGVKRVQFDLSIRVYVDGRWVPGVIRHHRSTAQDASGKTGIQLESGFASESGAAQQLWTDALSGRVSNPTAQRVQPDVVDLTGSSDEESVHSLDLNRSPPRC